MCTANICRSPTAEYLARSRFGEGTAFFRSAGFLSAGNQPPDLLAKALDELGVDVTPHRSYRLDGPSLDGADLVLTMEGEHVQKATLIDRDSYPKILPLREAAEVARVIPGDRLAVEELLEAVNRSRDPSAYLSPRWDVDDPYNRKLKDYRRAVAELDALVGDLIGRLL